MPAKRRRTSSYKASNKKRRYAFIVLAVLVAFVVCILIVKRVATKQHLYPVVIAGNEEVYVISFDLAGGQITTLSIPGTAVVDVYYQLGKYRVDKLWELGYREGYEGELLMRSIIKTLKIPVLYWADSQGLELASRNPLMLLKTVISLNKTNLTKLELARLAVFSIGVGGADRKFVDLGDSQYFSREELIGGETGYVVSQLKQTGGLIYHFADESSENPEIMLVAGSVGNKSVMGVISEVYATLGVRVTNLSYEDNDIVGCVIKGRNRQRLDFLALLFECESRLADVGNYDYEMEVGDGFINQF